MKTQWGIQVGYEGWYLLIFLNGHFKGKFQVLRTKSNSLAALTVLSLQRMNLTDIQTVSPSQQDMYLNKKTKQGQLQILCIKLH